MKYLLETHIQESRLRSIYCLVSLGFALCMSYMSSTELLFLCIKPLLCLDKSFILWSLGSVLPVFLYHTWCFIAPGCFPLERERWGVFCLLCSCFAALAVGGAYNVVLPQAASILLTFEVADPVVSIQLQARIGPYIDLSLKVALLAFAILQFPLLSGVCFTC